MAITYKKMPNADQNDPQIREYAEAVERGRKSIHIFRNGDGWKVKRIEDEEGKFFTSKEDAMVYARENIEDKSGTIFIHGENGLVMGSIPEIAS